VFVIAVLGAAAAIISLCGEVLWAREVPGPGGCCDSRREHGHAGAGLRSGLAGGCSSDAVPDRADI